MERRHVERVHLVAADEATLPRLPLRDREARVHLDEEPLGRALELLLVERARAADDEERERERRRERTRPGVRWAAGRGGRHGVVTRRECPASSRVALDRSTVFGAECAPFELERGSAQRLSTVSAWEIDVSPGTMAWRRTSLVSPGPRLSSTRTVDGAAGTC